ncbi:hypothetical protein CASFOL_017554 [Castilleja foliolosa]|uniref:Uncharacterized protein n=1 Tax=Castilleja foliolosa TaxID=1961234 RepID=A0ABD3DFI4_9LAMI
MRRSSGEYGVCWCRRSWLSAVLSQDLLDVDRIRLLYEVAPANCWTAWICEISTVVYGDRDLRWTEVRQVVGWLRRFRSATEVLSKFDRLSDTCGSRRDWCSGMLKGDVVFRPQRGGVRYDSVAKDDVERT